MSVAFLRHLVRGLSTHEILTEAIDILIVYYLIYRVLLLIKGTRAAQMLIGMLLLLGGFLVAKQFELATVSWLLDNFVGYGILLVIVVFQHDIRRALVRIGRNLFALGHIYEQTSVIEEVVQAASALASTRTGALIVLERDAAVGEFIQQGVEIDATVTRELLVSLFLHDPRNVLHDGAVVIRNLRIALAGALLPLSANPTLDKSLGTRHRSAVGLSEEADAVCIVVSEERGGISVCHQGNMMLNLDEPTLRRSLLSLFQKERRRRRKRNTLGLEKQPSGAGFRAAKQ